MTTARDLFSDLPAPAPRKAAPAVVPDETYHAPVAHSHHWYPGLFVWTGETSERLVWFCKTCPEIRGRA